MAMHTLVPRKVYDTAAPSMWRLLAIFIGVAVGQQAFEMWVDGDTGHIVRQVIRSGLFLLLGAVISVFAYLIRREDQREYLDKIYYGNRSLIGRPPPAEEYPFRLPCTRYKGWVAVPGVLYLGGAGLLFVPNRNQKRHMDEVRLEAGDPLAIRMVLARGNIVIPLIHARRSVIEVRTEAASARFWVPAPASTIELMKNAVRGTNVPAVPH